LSSAPIVSRRGFLQFLAGAGLCSTSLLQSCAHSQLRFKPDRKTKICIFSKHLQWLDYPQMAEAVREMGFDGIDLTVRADGHVWPENVASDLPRAVAAARQAGTEITMITTSITDPAAATTTSILKTAAELGIRYYRMGWFKYPDEISIPAQIQELKPKFKNITRLNQQLGIYGGYQNHAGNQRVGAALWDLWELLKNHDPEWIGCQFDVRHATVEGGTIWPTSFRLLAPWVRMAVIKDFRWEKTETGWIAQPCPLGQGMVDIPRFLSQLKAINFHGPISLHFEYPLGGAEHGHQEPRLEPGKILHSMRTDLQLLRKWMSEIELDAGHRILDT